MGLGQAFDDGDESYADHASYPDDIDEAFAAMSDIEDGAYYGDEDGDEDGGENGVDASKKENRRQKVTVDDNKPWLPYPSNTSLPNFVYQRATLNKGPIYDKSKNGLKYMRCGDCGMFLSPFFGSRG